MRTFFLYYLLARLLGNPFLALLVLVIVVFAADRRFVGLLPDITKPWKRSARIRQLRAAVDAAPFDARSQLELGMLLFEAGRSGAALPYLEKAASKLSDHATALYTLGAAQVETGNCDAGAASLRKAVALRPEVQYGMPYVYLAKATLGADTDEKGSAELDTWVDTVGRYGNSETCYRMGVVLSKYGEISAAKRMLQEAITTYRQAPPFARRSSRRWALLARWQLTRLPAR